VFFLCLGTASCGTSRPSEADDDDDTAAGDDDDTLDDDDSAGDDDDSAEQLCAENEHVLDNGCAPCDPGTSNEAGDDPAGADTNCTVIYCGEDEYVVSNECVSCAAGTSNESGDDASSEDTTCDVTYCDEDEYVQSNVCTPCPAGMINPLVSLGDDDDSAAGDDDDSGAGDDDDSAAGDDASGPDTTCVTLYCAADERVVANECVSCAAGTTNVAGDDATGSDTVCDMTTTVSLAPVADSHVNSTSPNSNSGNSQELIVDRSTKQTYLRFDLSTIPSGAIIDEATLTMTAHTGFAYGGNGNVHTYFVGDDSWLENSINYNNAPAHDSSTSLGSWFLWYDYNDYAVRIGTYTSEALRDRVAIESAGDRVLSLRVSCSGYRTNYRSREYADASARPQLSITYTATP
jgi:hypothetical protein